MSGVVWLQVIALLVENTNLLILSASAFARASKDALAVVQDIPSHARARE